MRSVFPLSLRPLSFLPSVDRRAALFTRDRAARAQAPSLSRLSISWHADGRKATEATLNMPPPWTHSLLLLVPLDDVYLNMVLRLNPSTILRLSSYRVGRQVEEKVLQHVFREFHRNLG